VVKFSSDTSIKKKQMKKKKSFFLYEQCVIIIKKKKKKNGFDMLFFWFKSGRLKFGEKIQNKHFFFFTTAEELQMLIETKIRHLIK
jgi:hypothetical protein